jgi:molybdopterin molybdotransferase
MPLLPVDDVLADLLSKVSPTRKITSCALDDALGRYLAADITSLIDVPPEANSAMDGYAVKSSEIVKDNIYVVSDRIPAGRVGAPLAAGTVARIFTGAPVPDGADAVVIQENTESPGDNSNSVVIRTSAAPGENVRPRGQDIAAGTTILKCGRRLSPQDLGLIASVGIAEVEVFERLTISIMSTGDELVEPPESLRPGQIYNSNRFALAGLLKNMGMDVVDLGVIEDTPGATEEALRRGARESDCIVSTGGVSVGEEDYVRDVVESLGRLDIWRIAIKPGKPLAFGEVLGTPFFGLPGNPVSTFVTFIVIARPYLVAYQGGESTENEYYMGEAEFEYKGGARREYLRVQAEASSNAVVLRKFSKQGSGVMSSVSWANALAEVEIGQQVGPGDMLRYYLL